MTIAITGATGHLGGLVVDALLDQGLSADDLVAVVRTPSKAARLAERGVEVREASYTDSGALEKALYGVDKLLLVSGSEIGQRAAQHANAGRRQIVCADRKWRSGLFARARRFAGVGQKYSERSDCIEAL